MATGKKSRAGRILTTVIIFILLMVLTFFISYFCVSKMYSSYLDEKDAITQSEEEEVAQQEAEENVANCGFTMVYLDNLYTEEVDYCVLRIFNELSCEMSVFQIPTDSQVTLSEELYETLSENTDVLVNKTVYLSEIGTYFTERETKYEMLNLVIQELIGGVEVRSYEALDYDTFVQIVDLTEPVTMQLTQIVSYTDEYGSSKQLVPNRDYDIDGRMALGILTYDDGFGSGDSGRIGRSQSYLMEFVTSMTENYTDAQMDEFLSSYYTTILCTGSTDSETNYLDDILNLTEENLSFYTLKGTQGDGVYVLDPEKIQADIEIIMGETAYAIATGRAETENDEENATAAEEATTESAIISSEGLSIGVYNGAYISGIAGRWSEVLRADGYTVDRVDNYTETLMNGKIIVKEEGMGKDLQEKYFPNATIEVGTPEYGMDIQIILGKSEDF